MRQRLLFASVAAAALVTAPAAYADEAPVDEVVVTGESLPRPAGAEAYGSTVIPRQGLTDDASGRIETILKDVAGFQQFRRTDSRAANPSSQGATLRALGGNATSRALVLLDGAPQADPFAGWIPWSALSPNRLGAVRVTSGGGAGPFGAGALTGVIELQSAGPADQPAFEAQGALGSRDAWQAEASGALRLGQAYLTLSGALDRGDGYILIPKNQRGPVDVPARYDQHSVSARLVAPLGEDLEVQVRGLVYDDDRRRGLVGAEAESRGKDASLRVVGRGAVPFEAIAYVQDRTFSTGVVSVNAARTATTPTLDQYDTPAHGLGGKFEVRPVLGPGHDLQVGVDFRRAEGETREHFRFMSGAFTRNRVAGGGSLIAGVYVEDSLELNNRLTLTGGVRGDHWRLRAGQLNETDLATGASTLFRQFPDRSGWEPTGRAGAVFKASETLDLRGAAYLGFRIPTLNELYRPFRVGADVVAANPALKPERLKGVEAGVDLSPSPALVLHATVFYNRLDNAIANVTRGMGPGVFPDVGFVAAGGAYRQRENLDAIEVAGLEASGDARWGDLGLHASYAFTSARTQAPGLELDGKRPAQTPRHQASVTLSWTPQSPFRAAVTGRYVSAQFEDDLETRRLSSAFTLDAVASWRLRPNFALQVRGENLFNEQVESGVSATGIIDRGTPRTLWLEARLRI
jgi:outer membrane receptor protein involved in Fe transport